MHSKVMILLINQFQIFPCTYIFEISSHYFSIHVVPFFAEAQNKLAQIFMESIATNIALKIALQAGKHHLSGKQAIYLRSKSSTKKYPL